MMAAKRTSTAPSRLPATVQKPLAPTVGEATAARRNPRFAPGEDVEVRSRFSQVSAGKRQLVIYARAKVVSASAGTGSYLVRYPAANSTPSRTARVPASDVRAARRVPLPVVAVDVARPACSKRPSPADRSKGVADGRKKAKRTGKGIPKDALLRFFAEQGIPKGELLRFFAEHEEEEEAKKQKPLEHDGELLALKLRPKTGTIKMVDRACPVFVSVLS